MSIAPSPIEPARYQRMLGDELRRVRRQHGWTRKMLQAHLMPVEVAVQTLATYELGTRQLTVTRLVELCAALGTAPHTLLARVHERLCAPEPAEAITLDLPRLIHDQQPELAPFRRWAAGRLHQPGAFQQLQLDRPAIAYLAPLCGLDHDELLTKLRPYASVRPASHPSQ